MSKLIDKEDLIAEIDKRLTELWDLLPNTSDAIKGNYTKEEANITGQYTALESFENFLNTLAVKEVDLEKIIEQTYHDRSVTDTDDMDHVTYENIAKHFFELGLAKQTSEDIKIGETKIYINDDGGESPYDGKQWLDISCTEYEIPTDKFKDGDKVELIIRKKQKGE